MHDYNGPYINFFRAGDLSHLFYLYSGPFRALKGTRMAKDGRGARSKRGKITRTGAQRFLHALR